MRQTTKRNRRHHVSFLGLGLAALLSGGCGDAGPRGPAGPSGQGAPGTDGTDGTPGADGKDGEGAALDPALAPLDKAFAGIGGKKPIEDLASFRVDSAGTRRALGEQFAPEDAAAPACAFKRTLSVDLKNDALRNDIERTVTWEKLGVMHQFSEIVSGDLGHIVGVDNLFGFPQGDMLSDGTAAIRRENRLLYPHLLLRALAKDPSAAADGGLAVMDGVLYHLIEISDSIAPITLFVSATTGRIARLSTIESDPLLRDVAVDVYYADWRAMPDGLQFPMQVALTVDGELLFEETRSSVEPNVALDPASLELPPDANPTFVEADAERGAATAHYHQEFAAIGLRPAFDGLQTMVVPTEVAPGVFHLTGGTHHSMAVEQESGVVFVEAPLYDARSKALLAWAATQFPGKPVTHVIATHYHIDHSGGLREMVAAGATLVAGKASAELYQRVLSAPSAVQPDTLAQSPVDPSVTLVSDDDLSLPDPVHPITVRRLITGHADDMLVVELPNDQVIFESDFFNPGVVNFKEAEKLLRDDMVARGLTSFAIVEGHTMSGPATFADLEADIGEP